MNLWWVRVRCGHWWLMEGGHYNGPDDWSGSCHAVFYPLEGRTWWT